MSMEMQIQSNPNSSQHDSNDPSPTTSTAAIFPFYGDPFKASHHRRAHSDIMIAGGEGMGLSGHPCDGGASAASFDDDILATYIDVDELGVAGDGGGNCKRQSEGGRENGGGGGRERNVRTRLRHSQSEDGLSSPSTAARRGDGVVCCEVLESKKTVSPDKLAHLWAIDPKRAKRSRLLD